MMDLARAANWLKERRWWVVLLFVIVAGYSIGKDRALTDNARDAAVRAGTSAHA